MKISSDIRVSNNVQDLRANSAEHAENILRLRRMLSDLGVEDFSEKFKVAGKGKLYGLSDKVPAEVEDQAMLELFLSPVVEHNPDQYNKIKLFMKKTGVSASDVLRTYGISTEDSMRKAGVEGVP